MPTYEYECGSCTVRFERFQPITAAPVRKCPECGKRVRRLIGGGAAVLFRGSGFYQTDYRSSGRRQAAVKEPSAPASPCDPGGCKQPGVCASSS